MVLNEKILVFLLVIGYLGMGHGRPEDIKEKNTEITEKPIKDTTDGSTKKNATVPSVQNRFFGLDGIFNQMFPNNGFNQSPFGQNGGNGFYPQNQQFYPGNNQWPGNNFGQGWPPQTQYPDQGFYPNRPILNGGSYPQQGSMTGQGFNPNQGSMPGQGSYPNQGAMPDQGSYPTQGAMPDQGSYPNQGNMPDQGSYPEQGAMPDQGSYPEQGAMPGQGNNQNQRHPEQNGQSIPGQGVGGEDGTLDSIPSTGGVEPAPIFEQPDNIGGQPSEGENGPVPFPDTNQQPFNGPDNILGKPVDVPNTSPSDKIVFLESTESPLQRQCVQDCGSSSDYEPVCGTNGVTFYNTGKLKCARNCGIDVFVEHTGRCSEI